MKSLEPSMIGRRSSRATAAALLLLSLLPRVASAALGDCGQPTNSGTSSPRASDALSALRAAVGSMKCVPEVCDVSGNGSVQASDALAILRKAVGQNVAFNCPVCPASVCTPCTEAAIKQRIATLNGLTATATDPTPQLLTQGTSIIFGCSNTTITVSDSSWGDPEITKSGVIFAADDRGIKFKLAQPCYNRCLGRCSAGSKYCSTHKKTSCTTSNDCPSGDTCVFMDCTVNGDCGSGGSCLYNGSQQLTSPVTCTSNSQCGTTNPRCSVNECSETGPTARRFLKLGADGITVRGFAVDGFFDGIDVNSTNAVIDKMTLTQQCGDSIVSDTGAVGATTKNTTVQRGCDSCARHAVGPLIDTGTCSGANCYHMTYQDDTFSGCYYGVRASSQKSRILVTGGTYQKLSSSWPCNIGIYPGASQAVSVLDDVSSSTCNNGTWFGFGSHTVDHSSLTNNDQRGAVIENGSLAIHNTSVTNNGGVQSQIAEGGAVILSGSANLGDSASPGHNCIFGNTTVVNGNDSASEVNNQTATNVPAQYNYWANGSNPPSAGITGPVTTSPAWSTSTCP